MNFRLISIISLLLAFYTSSQAQSDTTQRSQRRGVTEAGVGTDLLKAIPTAADFRNHGRGEIHFFTTFINLIDVIAEAGYARGIAKTQDYNYYSGGAYLRLGADVHYNYKQGYLFFGGRIAGASTNAYVKYDIATYWGNIRGEVPHRTFSNFWIEGLYGVRHQIGKRWYLGSSFRGKIGLNSPDIYMPVKRVPGFGAFDRRLPVTLAINLTLTYRLLGIK